MTEKITTKMDLATHMGKISERLIAGVRHIHDSRETHLRINEFLECIAHATESEWAVLLKEKDDKWKSEFKSSKTPQFFDAPFESDWLNRVVEKDRGLSLETEEEVKNKFYGLIVENLGAIGLGLREEKSREERRLLLLGGKKVRTEKGFFQQEILLFLSSILLLVWDHIWHDKRRIDTERQTKRSIFRQSLYQGSRSGILEHGNDLLRLLSADSPKSERDFVQAAVMDAKLLLSVNPHQRIQLSVESEEERGQTMKGESTPLVRLVEIRKKAWEAYKRITGKGDEEVLNRKRTGEETDGVRNDLKDEFKGLWIEALNIELPEVYKLEDVVFKGASLDKQLINTLIEYYNKNLGALKTLRTLLFVLYCTSMGLTGIADKKSAEWCDGLCTEKIFEEEDLIECLSCLLSEFLGKWQEDERTFITSEWLACWFGIGILSGFPWDEFRKGVSPGRRVLFYRHFATYFLYLIHCIRNFGEPTLFRFSDVENGYEAFMDSALFLISEYAHLKCGLPRQVPLYKTLLDVWSSEALLYTIRAAYRDHLHHVLNVCLLGMVLMEAGIVERLEGNQEEQEKDNEKKARELNWILAGLLHDVGYCVDLNRHMLKSLEFLQSSTCLRKFYNDLSKYLKTSETTLSRSLEEWLATGKLKGKLDHGVISAMHVLFLPRQHLGEKAGETPDIDWYNEIKEALSAMIKHNLKEGISIEPQREPLSFLLILCDHIQEWDRPRIDSLKLRRFLTSQLYRARGSTMEKNTIVRYLKTNLKWDVDNRKVCLPQGARELSIHYRDASQENFEPALIWCQNSLDFQSINLEKWPADFELLLTLVHPLSKTLKEEIRDIDFTEMNLLEDFLRETGNEAFLANWTEMVKGSKNAILSYDYVEEKAEEIFKTVFKKDRYPITIREKPPNFYQEYVIWKERRIREAKLRSNRLTV